MEKNGKGVSLGFGLDIAQQLFVLALGCDYAVSVGFESIVWSHLFGAAMLDSPDLLPEALQFVNAS